MLYCDTNLFFLKGKRKLEVDLGELKDELEALSRFLNSKLKNEVISINKKIVVDSNFSSSNELKRLVTKFVYRKNLSHKYWVELKGDGVKINKFKRFKKKKKERKGPIPSTIKHGW